MLEFKFPSCIYLKKSGCWYSANLSRNGNPRFQIPLLCNISIKQCFLHSLQTRNPPPRQEHIQNTRVAIYVTNPHYYNSYTRIKLAYFYAPEPQLLTRGLELSYFLKSHGKGKRCTFPFPPLSHARKSRTFLEFFERCFQGVFSERAWPLTMLACSTRTFF